MEFKHYSQKASPSDRHQTQPQNPTPLRGSRHLAIREGRSQRLPALENGTDSDVPRHFARYWADCSKIVTQYHFALDASLGFASATYWAGTSSHPPEVVNCISSELMTHMVWVGRSEGIGRRRHAFVPAGFLSGINRIRGFAWLTRPTAIRRVSGAG